MSLKVYKNSRRAKSNGSQSEKPGVICTNGSCKVTGYQGFTITNDTITINRGYKTKFNWIRSFLSEKYTENPFGKISDVGASNGVVSFMAANIGYTQVHALDHDLECIQAMNKVKQHLGYNQVHPIKYSFGDPEPPAFIAIVGALIHWIYSCTALYGKFDQISDELRKLTHKYLIVEWVDPKDPAIRSFKHTSFNKEVIKEPYNKENFLKSLQKYFSSVQKVFQVTATRELYLCVITE